MADKATMYPLIYIIYSPPLSLGLKVGLHSMGQYNQQDRIFNKYGNKIRVVEPIRNLRMDLKKNRSITMTH